MKWDFSGTLQMLPTIYGVDFVEYMKIMLFVALLQPFQTSQFIIAGGLRGAGDTKSTAKITTVTVVFTAVSAEFSRKNTAYRGSLS